jgi:hypothetical protein
MLSIHPHPFYPTRYTAWGVLTSSQSTDGSLPYYSTIERYAIDLGDPRGISVHRRSSVFLNDGRIGSWGDWGISSSGHALWPDARHEEHILSLTQQKQLVDMKDEEEPGVEHSHALDTQVSVLAERIFYRIAPHTGAITSVSRGRETLHIEYYA